jgi:methyl-accepting chemotaxis protein
MSEDRLGRIETMLAEMRAELRMIRAEMVTKTDLAGAVAAVRADMATKDYLTQFATKADLEAAMAGVAKNVDITALGRQVRRLSDETAALREQFAVMQASMQQVVGTVGRFADLLQALANQQQRTADRVRALEDEREP